MGLPAVRLTVRGGTGACWIGIGVGAWLHDPAAAAATTRKSENQSKEHRQLGHPRLRAREEIGVDYAPKKEGGLITIECVGARGAQRRSSSAAAARHSDNRGARRIQRRHDQARLPDHCGVGVVRARRPLCRAHLCVSRRAPSREARTRAEAAAIRRPAPGTTPESQ